MTLDLSALDDISALIRGQDTGNGIRKVKVDAIQPDPNQPRKTFDEKAISELAASMQSVGIIQPPVVRTHDDGYLLISGERRWRAARQLGWEKIDVIVRDDLNSRAQLVENIQREALSPWEVYRVVSAELAAGTTHADLARSIGKSRTWVTAYAAVNHMPEPIVSVLREGRITDITALTQLHRLHTEMPEAAQDLLNESTQISRPMIERARSEAELRRPVGSVSAVQPSLPSSERNETSLRRAEAIAERDSKSDLTDHRASPKTGTRLQIRICAFYENASWVVDYRCLREIDGATSVKLEGEQGSFRFAPLGALQLQSIEWL
ncbi:MAG: ParB/RepB/Spo0J family partition protein [Rhodanobacteraceae bacterium]